MKKTQRSAATPSLSWNQVLQELDSFRPGQLTNFAYWRSGGRGRLFFQNGYGQISNEESSPEIYRALCGLWGLSPEVRAAVIEQFTDLLFKALAGQWPPAVKTPATTPRDRSQHLRLITTDSDDE